MVTSIAENMYDLTIQLQYEHKQGEIEGTRPIF